MTECVIGAYLVLAGVRMMDHALAGSEADFVLALVATMLTASGLYFSRPTPDE